MRNVYVAMVAARPGAETFVWPSLDHGSEPLAPAVHSSYVEQGGGAIRGSTVAAVESVSPERDDGALNSFLDKREEWVGGSRFQKRSRLHCLTLFPHLPQRLARYPFRCTGRNARSSWCGEAYSGAASLSSFLALSTLRSEFTSILCGWGSHIPFLRSPLSFTFHSRLVCRPTSLHLASFCFAHSSAFSPLLLLLRGFCYIVSGHCLAGCCSHSHSLVELSC